MAADKHFSECSSCYYCICDRRNSVTIYSSCIWAIYLVNT